MNSLWGLKNASLQMLMDAGCEHLFLWDDDAWPRTECRSSAHGIMRWGANAGWPGGCILGHRSNDIDAHFDFTGPFQRSKACRADDAHILAIYEIFSEVMSG